MIIKKKHKIGISVDKAKEADIKGIEEIKSDRPQWINNLQKDFVDDIKHDRNPVTNLKKAYLEMERGQIPSEIRLFKQSKFDVLL